MERLLTVSFERTGWRGIARRSLLLAAAFALPWAAVANILGGLVARISVGEIGWGVAIDSGAAIFGLGLPALVGTRHR